ncbi:tetratricopeptide repeat protein [Dictyocaulus viviparus]|uniref:Cell division cycle protein 27 homolog n=1 Tax=Dictyocaulus viviparus TaxID=29172 RepID=A0A0D8X826_DICVI|nr:tetratricopeptide repeat protein [Dictyocaulus viviparus]
MFRTIVGRAVASAAGLQFCATAICLSDKELSKKPKWYQKDVLELETSLKTLGRRGFTDSPTVLSEAFDTLKKFSDFSNVEVQWRLARACVEKSVFSKCVKEKTNLLHEAVEYAKKAFALDLDNHCAGAHKCKGVFKHAIFMYAIALSMLQDIDKKADRTADIIKHFELASEIDSNDAYTCHLLGVVHYRKKNYEEALSLFEKAEKIKEKFSVRNLYYMGLTLQDTGKTKEAIRSYIAAYKLRPSSEYDIMARSQAKAKLLKLNVSKEEYEEGKY